MINLNAQLDDLAPLSFGEGSHTIINIRGQLTSENLVTVFGGPNYMILALCAVSYYVELTIEHSVFSMHLYR